MTAPSALDRLGADWNELLARSRSDTIFLSWEWISAWWRAYAQDHEPCTLRVERDGRLLGLVPLCRRRAGPGAWWRPRNLIFMGDGTSDSDYLDCIAEAGAETAVAEAAAGFLAGRAVAWDVIRLNEIPSDSPSLVPWRRAAAARGWGWTEEPVPCAWVPLPDDWAAYLQSLKPRMRTKVRTLLRELDANPKARVALCEDAADLEPRLASLFALHSARWGAVGRSGVFLAGAKREFYGAMASAFLERGWLRFYTLAIEGANVAHQFCFEYGRRMFLLQEGYDPAWTDRGVGNALRAHVFRDCIARRLEAYDFLAGVTAHKLSWGALEKDSVRVTIRRPSVRSHAERLTRWATAAAKAGARRTLPARHLERTRRWLSRST